MKIFDDMEAIKVGFDLNLEMNHLKKLPSVKTTLLIMWTFPVDFGTSVKSLSTYNPIFIF